MHNYHRQDLDTIIFPSFFSSSFGPGLALLLPPHSVWFCLITFNFQILCTKVTFICPSEELNWGKPLTFSYFNLIKSWSPSTQLNMCKQTWLMGRFCSSWKNIVREICLLKLKHCVFIDLSVQFLRQKGGKTSKWGYNLYLLLLGCYVSNSIYLYRYIKSFL